MTAHSKSASRLTTYALALAVVTATGVVAGSVWTNANGQQDSSAAKSSTIDIMVLHSRADIASLPVLIVEQLF